MLNSLPLSWSRNDIKNPRFESVYLPLSGIRWVHSAEIPLDYGFEGVFGDLKACFGKEILIRGCDADITGFLAHEGFGTIRTGAEAIIDLKNMEKGRPSVRELVRRGMRWGEVEEIPFSELNAQRVSRFAALTVHGCKPSLKYLFRSGFDSTTRCFVFKSGNEDWRGAITVSTVAESGAHTEMILRAKNAPVGVMESLFVEAMNVLRDDGYDKLSLGEVPFITPRRFDSDNEISKDSVKEKLLFRAGKALKFAFDYRGFYRFKDKFNPEWRPVYICSSPSISWVALADLYTASRYFDLSKSELFSSLKSHSPNFLNKFLNILLDRC